MQPLQMVIILAMVIYAIYRQTRVSPAGGPGRFRLALIYGAVGVGSLLLSGWALPQGIGWAFLAAGIALSVIVGVARGLLTKVWIDADGERKRQGTWLTVSLFVFVIAAKIGMGVYAGLHAINDGANFSEVLVIVAIMIAVQAQIVHGRALALEAPVTVGAPPRLAA